MVKVCPLFSGSSGNSTYIEYQNRGILVDAGRNCKTILNSLAKIDVDPQKIEGILITHDHSDHTKALPVLTKKMKAPIYATQETIDYIRFTQGELQAPMYPINGIMELAGMKISPFDTPHDAEHSVGFRITAGERNIGYATDLGEVTGMVRKGIEGCDLVILESNYEERLLSVSQYPYYLKQRIKSNRGHLSNKQCAELAVELAKTGTKRFVLSHLSSENNTPDIARQTTYAALKENGFNENVDFTLTTANRSDITTPIIL